MSTEMQIAKETKELKEKSTNPLGDPTGWTSLLTIVILVVAGVVGFASRLFAVIRFESIIHEFDPWFNYRATAYMVEHNFYDFLNWFDESAWYPLGRIVGGTVYPGLMVTSGAIHYMLNMLNIPIHIREVCVFLAPVFSSLTAVATFLLTRELWNTGAGLFAACFIAIVPGYISRSVAGSYDNEGIAIFALQMTYFLWIRCVKSGSIAWACLCALSYFYMVSAWGGYVFIINLIPLHVLTLIIMGRYSSRLYVAYTTFFVLGQLMAMQIPFVGFQPVRTSEHMAAAGVFGLIQAVAFFKYIHTLLTWRQFKYIFLASTTLVAILGTAGIVTLTYAGYIAPWSGRFYSLWDTGYAKIHIILYAVTAVYFAGVMVRLMLTLTPCVCVLAGIAFSHTYEMFLVDDGDLARATAVTEEESEESADKRTRQLYDKAAKGRGGKGGKPFNNAVSATIPPKVNQDKKDDGSEESIGMNVRTIISVTLVIILLMFAVHCTWVTSNAYSSPSIVLASYRDDGSRQILDDFREAYYWLRRNTNDDARVMSWWDYGYQIAGMANKTTLVDNNTWNNSHIAMVGKAMSSNETEAYKIMLELDVDYVLVIFGGFIGYSGDDINKFLWMVRIAEGEHPKDIKESDYFTDSGEFRVDAGGSPILLNCLMYKMSYYRFGDIQLDPRSPAGFDRTRNVEIGNKHFELEHVEEAYTTEHWLVRIYRVLKPVNRPRLKYTERQVRPKRRSNFRKSSNRKGLLRDKPIVKKGKSPLNTSRK